MRAFRSLAAVLGAAAALTGAACARRARAPALPAGEEGVASWYGHPYHGRRAANGEIYDMDQLTAAHRTLAFGTWVRVHNLENGKNVEVRITDRGPFVDGRIIDLSRAAAQAIDMIGPGTARVRLRIIAAPASNPMSSERSGERYAIQAGSFLDRNRAVQLSESLSRGFAKVRVVPRPGDPPMWRVLVGEETSRESADRTAGQVRRATGSALVVLIEAEPAAEGRPPSP